MPIVLDDLDHRLLHFLQRDGAATLTALGDAVGLSASAVQRRLVRYRTSGLLRHVAVLDPRALGNTLAAVWVTMERDNVRTHAAFRARMRAAPEVQQCYVIAGEWDYLVILATTGDAHRLDVATRLFTDEGVIRRYETRLVFDIVKVGLEVPTGQTPRRRKKEPAAS